MAAPAPGARRHRKGFEKFVTQTNRAAAMSSSQDEDLLKQENYGVYGDKSPAVEIEQLNSEQARAEQEVIQVEDNSESPNRQPRHKR